MKAFLVARKSLLEMGRELQLLVLVLLLPLLFLGLTLVSYGDTLLVTYPVWVIDADPASIPSDKAPLVIALKAQRYVTDQPIFDITLTNDRNAADEALKDQTVTALVVIASNVSSASSVTLRGDALNMDFYRASTMLNNTIIEHADNIAGQLPVVQIIEEALGEAAPENYFDVYAPGIIIFALLMIVPQTAMLVAREIRWRTLRRLRITRLNVWELLGGISLAQMVVAIAQVIILFVGALALGFHNQGSLLLAIVVGLVVSFSAIGLGVIVACFSENDSQAANLGGTVAMLQVFLSGAFYQLSPMTVFTLAGHQIDLFDVFPATHGFSALQQVLAYGAGLKDIGFRLGAALILSIVYFAAGVVIFQRRQMQSNQS
ncbi:MAG: ABC transporter permease [Chloroflexi bacterium]|nr:ABC transporter permease [Chloroflexota bacterium]